MLWPRGLFLWPLCYFLPHQIQTPHRGGSLSLSLKCHDPLSPPHPTCIAPSSRSPPPACSSKLSFPDAHPPPSWAPEKILLCWKTGFSSHPLPRPRLPEAQRDPGHRHLHWAGPAYQQLACFKVPGPQSFVVGRRSNSGNNMTSRGSL